MADMDAGSLLALAVALTPTDAKTPAWFAAVHAEMTSADRDALRALRDATIAGGIRDPDAWQFNQLTGETTVVSGLPGTSAVYTDGTT